MKSFLPTINVRTVRLLRALKQLGILTRRARPWNVSVQIYHPVLLIHQKGPFLP